MLTRALEQQSIIPDETVEATNNATNNAIETIQSLTSLLHLPNWIGRVLFIIIAVIVIMILVKIVNKFFRRTTETMAHMGDQNVTLVSFARYVVLVIIYFIGSVVVISSIPGAGESLTALLASGGIVAVIVGFAAQDTLSNVAGGVMILFFKPFVIGDYIRYIDAGVAGTIEEITLRHTAIRTAENKRLIIPNGKINGGVIENANYADTRVCEFFNVGITYESDLERAIELLRQEVMKQPLHLDVRDPLTQANDPEVQVEVAELADSAVILRAWLWAEDFAAATKLKFALNRAVKARFDAEGIEFAYPHMAIVK